MTSNPNYGAARATSMSARFRGFLPVAVDVETGGFDCTRHALLEIAAVPIRMDDAGLLYPGLTVHAHVTPFHGAELDPKSLEITGIDPDNPLRGAVSERTALDLVFKAVRRAVGEACCQRAVLVGHNAAFDLNFLNAAVARVGHKRNPFHPFSCFDTVSLAGLAFGQTVLGRAAEFAGLPWDNREAHSAIYDAETTAALFCLIVNRWRQLSLLDPSLVEMTPPSDGDVVLPDDTAPLI
ncbi:ribonuclease T [Xanthomonadaceae bacterium JHOS43]|nr:ribonuclease T [Xanthomonadaceae bacterium JHOS43]MCX7563225.1 ribonuclease T [Xanthomonadaceae bacterium XH05]